jgi:hypothetical protein
MRLKNEAQYSQENRNPKYSLCMYTANHTSIDTATQKDGPYSGENKFFSFFPRQGGPAISNKQ